MTQAELGEAIGMAQTWVSKLENPDYGKMTLATLLRLAEAFDADLEVKFRPFSEMLEALTNQGTPYFEVPSFEEEFGYEKEAVAVEHSDADRFLRPHIEQRPDEKPRGERSFMHRAGIRSSQDSENTVSPSSPLFSSNLASSAVGYLGGQHANR